MLKYFSTLYARHVLEGDGIGFEGQPTTAGIATNAVCKPSTSPGRLPRVWKSWTTTSCGWPNTISSEGYECLPNLLMP